MRCFKHWIKSFITGRTQRVRVGDQYSVNSEVDYGVPQGSVLGPILSLLYTVDVLIVAARHGVSAHVHADHSAVCTHNYRELPGSIWTPDIMHQWNRCLDDFKQTEIKHRQNTCLGISYQLAKVDASVIVISCVLSPALALVSTRSLRLPITSEVSHIGASFVPSRAEDCTFPVVVWQWLSDRDCTAQHNWSARDYWLSAILSFCFYYLFNFVRCPGLQCLWRDSVTLISTLLLTYLLTY